MAEQVRSRFSVLGIILAFILIIVIGWFGYTTFFSQNAPISPYHIISTNDISAGGASQAVVNVGMETQTPSLADLSMVALQVWKDQEVEWDQLTVFFYLPGMSTDDEAYAVANVDPDGVQSIHLIRGAALQPDGAVTQ